MKAIWLPIVGVALLAGCADRGALLAPGNRESGLGTGRSSPPLSRGVELARIDCRVDAVAGTVDCGGPLEVGSAPGVAAAGYATFGGQHRFARLIHEGTAVSGTEIRTLSFDVRIQNLTFQPWGTDGQAADEQNGIRVVFVRLPEVVTVEGAGKGAIIGDEEQYYYRYDEILAPGDTTDTELKWRLTFRCSPSRPPRDRVLRRVGRRRPRDCPIRHRIRRGVGPGTGGARRPRPARPANRGRRDRRTKSLTTSG